MSSYTRRHATKVLLISVIVVGLIALGGYFLGPKILKWMASWNWGGLNGNSKYDYSINLTLDEDGTAHFKQPKTFTEDNESGTYYKYTVLGNTAEAFLTWNDKPKTMDGDYYVMDVDLSQFGNYVVGQPYTLKVARYNVELGYMNMMKYYETYIRHNYGVKRQNDIQFTIDENGNFKTLSDYYNGKVESITTLFPLEECLTVGESITSGNAFVVNLTDGSQIEFALPLNFTNQIPRAYSDDEGKSGTAEYKIGDKSFVYNYYITDLHNEDNRTFISSKSYSSYGKYYYKIENLDLDGKTSLSLSDCYWPGSAYSSYIYYTDISADALNSIKHIKQLACHFALKAGDLAGFDNLETLTITTSGAKIYELFDGNIPASLETIIIYNSTSIPDYFFYGCSGIENVILTSAVDTVSEHSFTGLNIKKMTVSGNFTLDVLKEVDGTSKRVTREGLENLEDVRVSYGTTKLIASFASYKSTLKSIFLPDSVKTLDSYSLKNVRNLQNFRLPNGLETINSSAFEHFDAADELNFPNVKTIESWAFQCATVKKLTFSNRLKNIVGYAFWGCSNLETLIIPSTSIDYGPSALLGQTNVKELHISGNKPINDLFKDVTDSSKTLEEIYKLEKLVVYGDICSNFAKGLNIAGKTIEITLDDSVKSIGSSAFSDTNVFTTLDTNKVEKINASAFADNTTLSDITFSTSLTYVGADAFDNSAYASSKSVILIGDGVLVKYRSSDSVVDLSDLEIKYIMNGTFANTMTELTLGAEVKQIEKEVFLYTKQLQKLTLLSHKIEIINDNNGYDLFSSSSDIQEIRVNLSDINDYQGAKYWKVYKNIFAPL